MSLLAENLEDVWIWLPTATLQAALALVDEIFRPARPLMHGNTNINLRGRSDVIVMECTRS